MSKMSICLSYFKSSNQDFLFHYYIFHFPVFWLLIFETHRSALSEHRIDHDDQGVCERQKQRKRNYQRVLCFMTNKNPDALKRSLLSKPSLKKIKPKFGSLSVTFSLRRFPFVFLPSSTEYYLGIFCACFLRSTIMSKQGNNGITISNNPRDKAERILNLTILAKPEESDYKYQNSDDVLGNCFSVLVTTKMDRVGKKHHSSGVFYKS